MVEGIWLGKNARTEEVLIGTERGVVKCRIVQRLPEDHKWDKDAIRRMNGSTSQPVPNIKSDHVPVEINEDGSAPTRHQEDADAIDHHHIALEEDIDKYRTNMQGKADDVRVHARDTAKYGFTLGAKLVTKTGITPTSLSECRTVLSAVGG